MADLVAFLAARLGEDEFEAGQVICEWHDNDRRRREVAAKRAILELHDGPHECSGYNEIHGEFDNCMWINEFSTCTTVRHLAAIYSDHPDYDEAWKMLAPQWGRDDGDG